MSKIRNIAINEGDDNEEKPNNKKVVSPNRIVKKLELKARIDEIAPCKNDNIETFYIFIGREKVDDGFSKKEWSEVKYPGEWERDPKTGKVLKDEKGNNIPSEKSIFNIEQNVRRFNRWKESFFEIAAGKKWNKEKHVYESSYYAVPKKDAKKVLYLRTRYLREGADTNDMRQAYKFSLSSAEKQKIASKIIEQHREYQRRKKKQTNDQQ